MTAPAVLPHRYAMVGVGEVTPHPANANVGDVAAIAGSISELGFYGVLLVHEATGHILAGEHRWRAAASQGLAELPAVVIDCDDATAAKILAGDNEYAKLGHWDQAKLIDLLRVVEGSGSGLAGSGFDSGRLAALVTKVYPPAPDAFREFGDDIATDYRCPHCGFEWSGKPQ